VGAVNPFHDTGLPPIAVPLGGITQAVGGGGVVGTLLNTSTQPAVALTEQIAGFEAETLESVTVPEFVFTVTLPKDQPVTPARFSDAATEYVVVSEVPWPSTV